MPQPIQYTFPVKRQGLILAATWVGADDDLALEITYTSETGSPALKSLRTSNATEGLGEICLPSSASILDISRDAIIASVRMATMISRTTPGSKEWDDAMTSEQDSVDFQMAIGNVKMKEARIVNDALVELDMVKKGSSTPIKTVLTDIQELSSYTFTPETQLLCVAGALEKEFPTYIHNYPSTVLSQAQKDAIAAYVPTLALWI
jgi:hypothetical protein